MDIKTILIKVAIGIAISIAAGIILTFTSKILKLINTKLKDGKLKTLLNGIFNIVDSGVKCTFQTIVQGIKGTTEWTSEKQDEVLKLTIDAVKSQLSKPMLDYIKKQTADGNIDKWISTQIHADLYNLKNTSPQATNNTTVLQIGDSKQQDKPTVVQTDTFVEQNSNSFHFGNNQ